MTIPSTQRKAGPLLGTGAQTAWPFTFKVFAESDIAVTIADELGAETTLVLNTDYSVALNSNQDTSPGGTVTYPISGTPLAVGSVLSIVGDIAYDQPLDLPAGGNFSPLALENQLDRQVMHTQQLAEGLSRALKIPVSSIASAELPAPVGGEIFGWDATGTALIGVPSSSAVATDLAVTSAAAAAASAADSEVSNLASGVSAAASAVSAAASEVSNLASGVAKTAAEAARDAAIVNARVFPTEPAGRSKGVLQLTTLVGGSGGTNGTFALAFSGGAGTSAGGYFIVAGGIVTTAVITHEGYNYTSAPTVSFAASSGLVGASAVAVIDYVVNDGEAFKVQGSGDVAAYEYRRTNSTTSVLIATYPSSSYIDAIWQKHVNLVAAIGVPSITNIAANTITFSCAGGNLSNGKDTFKSIPALSSIALANANCLYLDITNLSAITWSTASSIINVKDDRNKLIVFTNLSGILYSPIPSVMASCKAAMDVYNAVDVASINTALRLIINESIQRTVINDSDTGLPVITSISGTAVTFSVPASHYWTFNSNYATVPALPSTTLTNTQFLYLNIANPASPVWVTGVSNSGNAYTGSKMIAIINFYGRLYSPMATLQSALDRAHTVYATPAPTSTTYTERLIAPSGGDYASISAAIAAITDASVTNQYRLHIDAGTYENEAGPNGFGIELKDYIHLDGVGRGKVFIRGVEGASSGVEVNYDTIHKLARCTVQGVSLLAYKNKYCVHTESNADPSLAFTLKDADCQHYGGASGSYQFDIGTGLYSNQKLTFDNVNLLGAGFFMHSQISARANNTSFQVALKGVTAKEFIVADYLDYTKNKVILDGCDIGTLRYSQGTTYYDLNVGNPLYNRGYYNTAIDLQTPGSKIGRIDYTSVNSSAVEDAGTLAKVGKRIIVGNMNARCVNKGAGAIARGEAVKLLADSGIPNAYALPPTNLGHSNVALWNGSGVFGGFAESAMAVDGLSARQFNGSPYALADASGTAIVYGDELEVNSSGRVVKRTTGILRGYALEALASSTGLIKIKVSGA